MRVSVLDAWQFPNGTFIFDAQGTQINPNSPQGETIKNIYAMQETTKIQNLKQTYKVEEIRQRDIDNDGVIGDPAKIPKTTRKKRKKSYWE